ncbi:hypothetical protein ACN27J_14275 [Solwaraspora sp. WMMB762]|uniref:hypothetical protein n=1 Tax=Solwaraspora sp. WMMB762 TaxID=3404120 RepID=UPI003B9279D3
MSVSPRWAASPPAGDVAGGCASGTIVVESIVVESALRPSDPRFDVLGHDPLTAVRRSVDVAVEAFARPGVLDTVVHHPAGDMRGRRLAGLCFNDNLVHGWDLAQAIGVDATLDPVLVEAAHAYLAPVAGSLPRRYFATAPEVGPTKDRQIQLLALQGRDPRAWNRSA